MHICHSSVCFQTIWLLFSFILTLWMGMQDISKITSSFTFTFSLFYFHNTFTSTLRHFHFHNTFTFTLGHLCNSFLAFNSFHLFINLDSGEQNINIYISCSGDQYWCRVLHDDCCCCRSLAKWARWVACESVTRNYAQVHWNSNAMWSCWIPEMEIELSSFPPFFLPIVLSSFPPHRPAAKFPLVPPALQHQY